MKRLIVALVMSLMTVSIFSLEREYESFGFNFSLPIVSETSNDDDITTDSQMVSIGFGLHALTLYTENVGVYVNLDLVFPQTIDIRIDYSDVERTYSLNRSDYDSLWGLALLIGPAFSLYKSDKALFTIAPGIYYSMLYAQANTAAVSYIFGLGMNIQDSLFFGTSGYITFGADLAFDFLGITLIDGESNSGSTSDFIFNPKVGIGFRY